MIQSAHDIHSQIGTIMTEKQIEWISTAEAAEIMDIALSTVSRLCRETDKLVCRQFGKGYRSIWQVSRASAEAYEKSVGGRPKKPTCKNL